MKTYCDLFDSFVDFGNLYQAWRQAAKGKRGRAAAATFELGLADELVALQTALRDGTWRPGAYRSFRIRDPKPRLVSAAPFADRVVHHALCNVIGPIFERTFIGDSYANRVGKGTHAALDRAQALARRYRYVLQCDVREYFPSIDHAILEAMLCAKLRDERLCRVIRLILDGGAGILDAEYTPRYFPGDDLFAVNRPRGLPIGNLTSQIWANIYLNVLDQYVKRELRCPAYLRYVDDFLLFSDDKRVLWAWKDAVRACLGKLRLTLHEVESTVYPVDAGIPFLGFRIYPTRRRLKRRNGVYFQRRLRRYYRAYAQGDMELDEMKQRVRGWVAHAEQGDTHALRRSLFARPLPVPARRAGRA